MQIYKEISSSSPLSPEEESLAKKYKPALGAMKKKYGDKKGEEYFYGLVRNKAKHK